jgi:3-hydroxyacyl-CoA dehydrogenase/enoyl-CoA hydratase/3-hydroxybutyryl-CoA epimerase
MSRMFTLSTDVSGIAHLVMDLPGEKVNKLSEASMAELNLLLDVDLADPDIKALIISSSKPGVFIAGADINEIDRVESDADALEKSRRGQAVFNKLAALPYPTVAVIDGACLGGGMELALACSFRIATDHAKTKLGLPEVSLGILPGWGGTQRLPRLVGLVQALTMILSGKPVAGSKAARIGLVDALGAHEFADGMAQDFAARCLSSSGRRAVLKKRKRHGMESLWPMKEIVLRKATENAMRKAGGHYPAIPEILQLMRETGRGKLSKGLEKEARAFSRLAVSPVCRNLIGLFHTDQLLKKQTGVAVELEPRPVRSAGVLGAGIMGGGIAWLFSRYGRLVRMKDVSWEAVARGYAEAADYYRQLVKLHRLKEHEAGLGMHRITGALDYSGFRQVDVVVEAVVEKMDVKKGVLVEVEAAVASDTVICSNTSALSITEMATAMEHPSRFVGMHFFNPVNRMPLVEVIAGAESSDEAVATVVALARALGKVPVVVKDSPGFLVNRILIPYMNEAGLLLQEGVAFERIDKLMEAFGMPMGPCVLADETGIDVGFKVIRKLAAAFAPRLEAASVLERMVGEGLLGRKAGGGFYLHEGRQRHPNAAAVKLIGRHVDAGADVPVEEDVLDRLILIMVNEAALCLQEGVIDRVDYLDMALITGIGFPPFRGGLLRYADSRGIPEIVQRLNELHVLYGARFEPAGLLKEMAAADAAFYGMESEGGTRDEH